MENKSLNKENGRMKFKVNKTKLQKDNKNLNKDTINLKDKINLNEDKINLNEYIINLNTDTIEKKNETLKIILNTNLPSPKKWDTDKIRSFGNNKAILGYLNAYFDHCPIKVSPNIIWQLILNSFSSYVNKNSESLREKFVNFFGKKDLMFIRVGTFKDLYKNMKKE